MKEVLLQHGGGCNVEHSTSPAVVSTIRDLAVDGGHYGFRDTRVNG